MRKLLLAVVMAAVAGCSTTHNPEDIGGGYSDLPLAQDTYQVDVRGTGYTSADTVRKIGLVRAADIAISHGYDKFIILGADGRTEQATPIIITNNRGRFVIKLIKDEDPLASNALDARKVIATYGPEV